jgi:hypothetical protein
MSLRRGDQSRASHRRERRRREWWAKIRPRSWDDYRWLGWGAAFSFALILVYSIPVLLSGATLEWR